MSSHLISPNNPSSHPLNSSVFFTDSLIKEGITPSSLVHLSDDREDRYLQTLKLHSSSVGVFQTHLSKKEMRHLIETLVSPVSFKICLNKDFKRKSYRNIETSIKKLSNSSEPADISLIKSLNFFLNSPFFKQINSQFEETTIDCSFYPFRVYQILLDLLNATIQSPILKIVGGFVRETVKETITLDDIQAMDIDIKVDAKQFIKKSIPTGNFIESMDCIKKISSEFLKRLIPSSQLFSQDHAELIVNMIELNLKNVKTICYQSDQCINIALGDSSSRKHDITITANTSVESICNLDSARFSIDNLIRLLNQIIPVGKESSFSPDLLPQMFFGGSVLLEGTSFFSYEEFLKGWLSKELKISRDYKYFNESAFIKLMDFISKGHFTEDLNQISEISKNLTPSLLIKALNNHIQKHVDLKSGFIVLLNTFITLFRTNSKNDNEILLMWDEFLKITKNMDKNCLLKDALLACFYSCLENKIPFSIILAHFQLIQSISLYSQSQSIVKSQLSSHLGLSIQIKAPFFLFVPFDPVSACKIITSSKHDLQTEAISALKTLVFTSLNPLSFKINPAITLSHSEVKVNSLNLSENEISYLFESDSSINTLQAYFQLLLHDLKPKNNLKRFSLDKLINIENDLSDERFIEILNCLKLISANETLCPFLHELYHKTNFSKGTALYKFLLTIEPTPENKKFILQNLVFHLFKEKSTSSINNPIQKALDYCELEANFSVLEIEKLSNVNEAYIVWIIYLANQENELYKGLAYSLFKNIFSFFKSSRQKAQFVISSLNSADACKFLHYLQKNQFFSGFPFEEINILKLITIKNCDAFISRLEKCMDLFVVNYESKSSSYELSQSLLKVAQHKFNCKISPLNILKDFLNTAFEKKLLQLNLSIENFAISLAETISLTSPISCYELLNTNLFKSFKSDAVIRKNSLLEKLPQIFLNLSSEETSSLKELIHKRPLSDKSFFQSFLKNAHCFLMVLTELHAKNINTPIEQWHFIVDYFSTKPMLTSFTEKEMIAMGHNIRDLLLKICVENISPSTQKKAVAPTKKAPTISLKNPIKPCPHLKELIDFLAKNNATLSCTILTLSYKHKLIISDHLDELFKLILLSLPTETTEDQKFIETFWTTHPSIFKINPSEKNDIFYSFLKTQKNPCIQLEILKKNISFFKHKEYFEECFKIFSMIDSSNLLSTLNLLESFLISNKNKYVNICLFSFLNNLSLNIGSASLIGKYLTKPIFTEILSTENYLSIALKLLQQFLDHIDSSPLISKILNPSYLKEMSKIQLKLLVDIISRFVKSSKSNNVSTSLMQQLIPLADLIITRLEKVEGKLDCFSIMLSLLSSHVSHQPKKSSPLSVNSLFILSPLLENSKAHIEWIHSHLQKAPIDEFPLKQLLIYNILFETGYNANISCFKNWLQKINALCRHLQVFDTINEKQNRPILINAQKAFEKTIQNMPLQSDDILEVLSMLSASPQLINEKVAISSKNVISYHIKNKNIQKVELLIPAFINYIPTDNQFKEHLKDFLCYLIDSKDSSKISIAIELTLKRELLNTFICNKIALILKDFNELSNSQLQLSILIEDFEALFSSAFQLNLHGNDIEATALILIELFLSYQKCKMTPLSSAILNIIPKTLSLIILSPIESSLINKTIENFTAMISFASNENSSELINVVELLLLEIGFKANAATNFFVLKKLYRISIELSLKIDDNYIRKYAEMSNAINYYVQLKKIINRDDLILLKEILYKSIFYLKSFYIPSSISSCDADRRRIVLRQGQEKLVQSLIPLLSDYFNNCFYEAGNLNKFDFISLLASSTVPVLIQKSGDFLSVFCDDFCEEKKVDQEIFRDIFYKLMKEKNINASVIDPSTLLTHVNINKIILSDTLAILYKEWLINDYNFFDNFDLNLYKTYIPFLKHDSYSSLKMAEMALKNIFFNLQLSFNQEDKSQSCHQFCLDFVTLLNTTVHQKSFDLTLDSTLEKPFIAFIQDISAVSSCLFSKKSSAFFNYLPLSFDNIYYIIPLISLLKALLCNIEEILNLEKNVHLITFLFNFIETFIQKCFQDLTKQNSLSREKIDIPLLGDLIIDFILSPAWHITSMEPNHSDRKNNLVKMVSRIFDKHSDDLELIHAFISGNFTYFNKGTTVKKLILKLLSHSRCSSHLVLGIDLLIKHLNENTYEMYAPLLDAFINIAFSEVKVRRKLQVMKDQHIVEIIEIAAYQYFINKVANLDSIKAKFRSILIKDVYNPIIIKFLNPTPFSKLFLTIQQKMNHYIFLIQNLNFFIEHEYDRLTQSKLIIKNTKANPKRAASLTDYVILKNYYTLVVKFIDIFKNYYILIKSFNDGEVEDDLLQNYSLSSLFLTLSKHYTLLSPENLNDCKEMFISWINCLRQLNTFKTLDRAKKDLNHCESFVDNKFELFKQISQQEFLLFKALKMN